MNRKLYLHKTVINFASRILKTFLLLQSVLLANAKRYLASSVEARHLA